MGNSDTILHCLIHLAAQLRDFSEIHMRPGEKKSQILKSSVMRLRECVISGSGQTCVETTNVLSLLISYIAGRSLEIVLRDIFDKWNYIPEIEAASIDFS